MIGPLLVLSALDHGFSQGRTVLAGLDLYVNAGEVVALVGASGSGKSTLLRLAAGLLTADHGTVVFQDREDAGPGPERALMLQDANLFPWLNVAGNVGFALARRGLSGRLADNRIEDLLQEVDLAGEAEAWPASLSGGMAQRVALARALAADPRLLLLDEPFSRLDALTRRRMQALVADLLIRHGTAALLATHDIEEAVLLADRVLVLGRKPARIIGQIRVGAPRPRPDAFRRDGAAVALMTRVEALLSEAAAAATTS